MFPESAAQSATTKGIFPAFAAGVNGLGRQSLSGTALTRDQTLQSMGATLSINRMTRFMAWELPNTMGAPGYFSTGF
jgi:hypothetical protein